MDAWKDNWETSRERFKDWWNRKGVLRGAWNLIPRAGEPHEPVPEPGDPPPGETLYLHPELRAEWNHYWLSRSDFPEDVLHVAETDIGPGSLALFLGCQPHFSPATVWFEPCWEDAEEVTELPELKFDPENRWWKLTEATLRESKALAGDRYLVGCPDLIENIDILSALREPQQLMLDMMEEPDWVESKVREITDAWIEAYERVYSIIRDPWGGSAFGAFRIWGPGKTAKVQCDASAMFSPDMFRRFVVPELSRQCAFLDYSLYHLDGTQAVCHLEALLEIESLDAIEWTPQAGIERGGHERWFPMYRRILEAGKSLQLVEIRDEEVEPILNAIGTEGVYLLE